MSSLRITNIGQLLTLAQPGAGRAAPHREESLGVVEGAEVHIRQGRIVWAGPREGAPENAPTPCLDAGGRVVMPGFIDCHTHAVWAGSREDEFARRCAGVPYATIAAEGGGIKRTVRETRAASFEQLLAATEKRLRLSLSFGCTTVEVKSGYGLDRDTELRQLRVIEALNARLPVDLAPTWLGAHEVPPEYAGRADAYLDFALSEVLPRVIAGNLARFADVYCESHVYSAAQAERFLRGCALVGLRPKIHAEQLSRSGGAQVAARVRAVSAEHLEYASDEDIEALAQAGVVAVLLPGAAYVLGQDFPDARRFLDRGVRVAVATDFNPGSSPSPNLPLMMHMACCRMRMAPAEAILAVTRHAAAALDLEDDRGSIEAGKRGDLVVLDCRRWQELVYLYGVNPVRQVIKDGALVEGGLP